ncbi:MAG: hypothetical protein ACI83P_001684, partial [Janthinobacterium sp.]
RTQGRKGMRRPALLSVILLDQGLTIRLAIGIAIGLPIRIGGVIIGGVGMILLLVWDSHAPIVRPSS